MKDSFERQVVKDSKEADGHKKTTKITFAQEIVTVIKSLHFSVFDSVHILTKKQVVYQIISLFALCYRSVLTDLLKNICQPSHSLEKLCIKVYERTSSSRETICPQVSFYHRQFVSTDKECPRSSTYTIVSLESMANQFDKTVNSEQTLNADFIFKTA